MNAVRYIITMSMLYLGMITALGFLIPDQFYLRMIVQGLLLLTTILYLKRKNLHAASYLHIKPVRLRVSLLLVLQTVFLILAASFVNECSQLFFKNQAADVLSSASKDLAGAVIVICILPSITEEIIFRGVFLQSFHDKYRGIIWSALLFSIWHLNFQQMSYAFLCGLLLGITFVWSGNLVNTMIIHCLFNFYNLLSSAASHHVIHADPVLFLEKMRNMLVPPFVLTDGTFNVGRFLQGFLVMVVSCLMYLLLQSLNRGDWQN